MGINPYFYHIFIQSLAHKLDQLEARHKTLANQLFQLGDKLQQQLMRTDLGSLQDSYLTACDKQFRTARHLLGAKGLLVSSNSTSLGETNCYYRSEP